MNTTDTIHIVTEDTVVQSILKLVSENRVAFLSVIRRMTIHYHEAEDILQSATIKAVCCANKFDPKKSAIRTWFQMIMMSQAKDFLRKYHNKKHGKTITNWSFNPTINFLADSHLDPSDEESFKSSETKEIASESSRYIDDETPILIEESLNRCSSKDKSLLILVYQNGLSQRDLSNSFGIPIGTAKSAVFRAKANFIRHFLAVKEEYQVA